MVFHDALLSFDHCVDLLLVTLQQRYPRGQAARPLPKQPPGGVEGDVCHLPGLASGVCWVQLGCLVQCCLLRRCLAQGCFPHQVPAPQLPMRMPALAEVAVALEVGWRVQAVWALVPPWVPVGCLHPSEIKELCVGGWVANLEVHRTLKCSCAAWIHVPGVWASQQCRSPPMRHHESMQVSTSTC